MNHWIDHVPTQSDEEEELWDEEDFDALDDYNQSKEDLEMDEG